MELFKEEGRGKDVGHSYSGVSVDIRLHRDLTTPHTTQTTVSTSLLQTKALI